VQNTTDILFKSDYQDIAINCLKTKKRLPRNIEIQQTFNVFLKDTGYGIGHLDDGMIHIGTNFCKNHDAPLCENCPINELCVGFNDKKELIDDYRT
jgi:adenine-specific DNA glycosylase